MIAEAFSVLEKEPRSLADTSVLKQTMSLEKFKFLTNSYICDRRKKKHAQTLATLQKSSDRKKLSSRKMQAKGKYISRLMLYNSQLRHASTISYDKPNDTLKGAELLSCNESWPLCLYDHTYKNRCISYFAYREKSESNVFVDDYFEEIKVTSRVSAKKDSSPSKEQLKIGWALKTYNSLLIERDRHYCTNKEFVAKINILLEQEGSIEGAFPSSFVELATPDEVSLVSVMENYINHVMNFNVDGYAHREVMVGGGVEEPDSKEDEPEKRQRSMSGKFLGKLVPEDDIDVKLRKSTICFGNTNRLRESMMDLYNRRAIAVSFCFADMAARMPFPNNSNIIANSPSGRLLKDIVENQINL